MGSWNATLWGQFGAAIDMLEHAIDACPEELWAEGPEWQQFWYGAYHCIFYLDYYLEDTEDGFVLWVRTCRDGCHCQGRCQV